ncbi:hypothetical protein PN36_04285 [Candidatus Thiomargarita nelsonii]|uniref:Uncharacterized protein n=1 Tax=Candidatus Thiomargarita nelsonii TaxID=1003181 RepID=A0A0A6P6N6_9GAMM|nr:hypothetical protein PN36_04285 [Candidatus Thiomargarita nelsonii]
MIILNLFQKSKVFFQVIGYHKTYQDAQVNAYVYWCATLRLNIEIILYCYQILIFLSTILKYRVVFRE